MIKGYQMLLFAGLVLLVLFIAARAIVKNILDKMKDATKMVIHGKVESGTVNLGDKLCLAPNNLPCQVLTITDSKN